jgi:uncharacterized protein YfaS (alpha-2-macroglobulin family)
MPYMMRQGRRIEVEVLPGPPGVAKQRKRKREVFVQVPLAWFARATKAAGRPSTFLIVWLLYLSWKARSQTFPVPNAALRQYGIDRRVKYRMLRELEAAGVIAIERRRKRALLVTLL